MSWFRLLRRAPPPTSAQTAKDRLQITLAHERLERALPEYLPLLQRDLLGVIRKYIAGDQVRMRVRGADRSSTLEVEIELPAPRALAINPAAAAAVRSALAR